ncbi:Uu.00g005980.m01.CDS01 [Anthostomella pinea]|uniref:Uu.00g005980.m01.CDS01 n=1 Tax=Anthostomella pinea TaxID=933095 RepID=A0AAI8YJ30_9PEZI|nr:Uu.00g005980.m01.CDS01 [Anthostomella pinea]
MDSESDFALFAAIPWWAQHLRRPRIVTGQPRSRQPKSNAEDTLFAETLKSQTAISAMLEVYEDLPSPNERIDHIKAFLTLGAGLNGHPGVCHGGLVMAILDEVIGMLIPINQKRKSIPKTVYMTAYLNTTFLKPVPTSATILARATITRVEGRKYFSEGSIENEKGVILARGEALFVGLKSAL